MYAPGYIARVILVIYKQRNMRTFCFSTDICIYVHFIRLCLFFRDLSISARKRTSSFFFFYGCIVFYDTLSQILPHWKTLPVFCSYASEYICVSGSEATMHLQFWVIMPNWVTEVTPIYALSSRVQTGLFPHTGSGACYKTLSFLSVIGGKSFSEYLNLNFFYYEGDLVSFKISRTTCISFSVT